MKARRTTAMAAGAALLTMGLFAAPSVEITAVQQQYPWTNTVDITYEVRGVTNMEYFVRFTPTTSDDDPILNTEGEPSIQVALESNGVFTAQWYPQTNLQYTACKMTPAIFRGGSGGGRDYMIVDLVNGGYYYEPMATQEAANERYNTVEYKTTKLVLRRIPADTYKIGDKNTTGNIPHYPNTQHDCTVPQDYYIGIFSLTEGQWRRIMGDSTADTRLPKTSIGYATIRGNALPAAIPSSGFFPNLCSKAELRGFDLPTVSMWEVAARAGSEDSWPFGNTVATDSLAPWGWYDNARHEVGLKRANAWGLYDIKGNVWNWCRDVSRNADLKNYTEQAKNAFKVITTGNSNYRPLMGSGYEAGNSRNNEWRFSAMWSNWSPTTKGAHVGFRVAWYPE